MEIKKYGTPPSEREWYGKCRSCGSEATAKARELTSIRTDQREGDYAWEICPVCRAGEDGAGFGGMLFYPALSRTIAH